MAKREARAYDIAAFSRKNKNNQSLVAASSYCVSPDRVKQQHLARLAPTPPHTPFFHITGEAEPTGRSRYV